MFKKLFAKKPATLHAVSINDGQAKFDTSGNKPLLDAALENGINLPHGCRAGGCGACKCKLVSGEINALSDMSYTLSTAELDQGYILACQSVPTSDVIIESDGLARGGDQQKCNGQITAVRELTHDILEVSISTEKPLDYKAGQFANIQVRDVTAEPRSYSFATAASLRADAQQLTFHIRKVPGGEFTEWLHAKDRSASNVTIDGPHGDFYLHESDKALLCVAGGSGMAPLKALLEQMQGDNVQRDVTYLFGARTQQDLYCAEEMDTLQNLWPVKFEFIPVLSEEPSGSDWQGLRGLVTDHIAADDCATRQIYMCGPPPMLDAVIDFALANGANQADIFFDKFVDKSHNPS